MDAPGAEFREEAAFSQSPGNSFLGMPDTGWFLLLWHTWDTRNTKLFYFLLTFPSSGESQLGKCGPASIRSMIHERIPLPVGRLQQPSAKVRCQKGKPCAGLSQMEHPSWLVAHASCSLGSRRTESSCQRDLHMSEGIAEGMGARGRKQLPSSSLFSSAAAVSLSQIVHSVRESPGMLSGKSPVWEGEEKPSRARL